VEAKSEKLPHKAESSSLEKSSFEPSAFSFQLKIGYDGKRAANNLTGLGNYSRSLIANLAARFPNNQYLVYTPKSKESISHFPLFSKSNVSLRYPLSSSIKFLWRSFGINKQLLQDQIELFHGLSHEIPYDIGSTGIKNIVTMHDLIFLRYPQYYKAIDRFIYQLKSKYACKHADRIIAISEQTKNDIVALYHVDPSKIDVIYQSCDDVFKTLKSKEEKEIVRRNYQLPDQYLLYVGTIEARKNLLLLIKALPTIDPKLPLIVIGRATPYLKIVKKEIEKLGLQQRVVFLNSVPFQELPAIYQMASCFVLPSYYEGFGIPIIEALYGMVPVVAATGSCLEEAGGPNSLYISPDDHEALSKAINTVLNDSTLQENMKQEGITYVQRFNSDVVTQQIMDCYLKTLAQ
jgi:glycosyltransferase involved in cell wall biosynthesis